MSLFDAVPPILDYVANVRACQLEDKLKLTRILLEHTWITQIQNQTLVSVNHTLHAKNKARLGQTHQRRDANSQIDQSQRLSAMEKNYKTLRSLEQLSYNQLILLVHQLLLAWVETDEAESNKASSQANLMDPKGYCTEVLRQRPLSTNDHYYDSNSKQRSQVYQQPYKAYLKGKQLSQIDWIDLRSRQNASCITDYQSRRGRIQDDSWCNSDTERRSNRKNNLSSIEDVLPANSLLMENSQEIHCNSCKHKEAGSQALLQELERMVSEGQNKITHLKDELHNLKKKLGEAESEVQKVKSERVQLSQQMGLLSQNQIVNIQVFEEMAAQRAQLDESIKHFEALRSQYEQKNSLLEKRLDLLKQQEQKIGESRNLNAMKQKEIKTMSMGLDGMKAELNLARKQRKQEESRLQALADQVNRRLMKASELEKLMLLNQREVSAKEDELFQKDQIIASKYSELASLENNLKDRQADLKLVKESIAKQNASLNLQLRQLQSREKNINGRELDVLGKEGILQRQLDSQIEKYSQLLGQYTMSSQSCEAMSQQLATALDHKSALLEKASSVQRSLDQLTDKYSAIQTNLADTMKNYQSLFSENESLRQQLFDLTSLNQEHAKQRQVYMTQIAQMRLRIDVLTTDIDTLSATKQTMEPIGSHRYSSSNAKTAKKQRGRQSGKDISCHLLTSPKRQSQQEDEYLLTGLTDQDKGFGYGVEWPLRDLRPALSRRDENRPHAISRNTELQFSQSYKSWSRQSSLALIGKTPNNLTTALGSSSSLSSSSLGHNNDLVQLLIIQAQTIEEMIEPVQHR